MNESIAEIAEKFINNVLEIFGGEEKKDFKQIEKSLLKHANNFASEAVGHYLECLDKAILADKAGRKELGCAVERRGDERQLQTQFGQVNYQRTYYKKASGGYEYLCDTVMGIESRERISEGLSLCLASAAKDMSYAKASKHITSGEISRQTIMHKVRRSEAEVSAPTEKRNVPELHIDADEAHITLCRGKKSEVPLISVYEGIERYGKRNSCKNVFHISEYGKPPDDLWEQALTEIEERYDLSDTKIYLHGDGAGWVQKGLEWIPDAVFVLDKYHKNKAIKAMTAGLQPTDRKIYDKEIREALAREDIRFFDELAQSLCGQFPERIDKIQDNAAYLKRFISGISICELDYRANNGGCTEPHVSHVLSARLSSRPMAWSKQTLKKLAPVLASGSLTFKSKQETSALPLPLRKAAASASKAFRRGKPKNSVGLPDPDKIGNVPLLNGKVTGTQKILKIFS